MKRFLITAHVEGSRSACHKIYFGFNGENAAARFVADMNAAGVSVAILHATGRKIFIGDKAFEDVIFLDSVKRMS